MPRRDGRYVLPSTQGKKVAGAYRRRVKLDFKALASSQGREKLQLGELVNAKVFCEANLDF